MFYLCKFKFKVNYLGVFGFDLFFKCVYITYPVLLRFEKKTTFGAELL